MILGAVSAASAQNGVLTLASASTTAGHSASMALNLAATAGSEPAGLQWTLTYPASNLSAISVAAGPALTAAGKTLTCAAAAGAYHCVAAGMNSAVIHSGVVATISASVPAQPAATTAISITDAAGASPAGDSLAVSGVGGNVTIPSTAVTTVKSLTCAQTTIPSAAAAVCTVTLSAAAPTGGAVIALSANSASLSVPASVSIPATAVSATFTATAKTVTSNQPAIITAAWNGSSQAMAVVVAPAGAAPTLSFACSPLALSSSGAASCTVTLAAAAPASGSTVSLRSSSALLTIPASVTVPAGDKTIDFTATAGSLTANSTATITASVGSTSQSVSITLLAPVFVTSIACSPTTLASNAATICTLALSKAPTSGFATVELTSSSPALLVQGSFIIPAGSSSGRIAIRTGALTTSETAILTATLSGKSVKTSLALVAPTPKPATASLACSNQAAAADASQCGANSAPRNSPVSLACSPRLLHAGEKANCELTMSSPAADALDVDLSASAADLKAPAKVSTRPGQSTLRFEVLADPAAATQTIALAGTAAGATVTESISILSGSPVLTAPRKALARFGSPLRFNVTGADPEGAPLQLAAIGLPAGATFDAGAGAFAWTPEKSQQGTFDITFSATNSRGLSGSIHTTVEVDSGAPAIGSILNAASRSTTGACSPGAIATIAGKWFTTDSAADPTGSSQQLGGVRVSLDGGYAPLLRVSPTEIDFLCPAAKRAGDTLNIHVETAAGSTNAVVVPMTAASPAIFSLDGTGEGQGDIVIEHRSGRAMARTHTGLGEPAQAQDRLLIPVTGLGDPAMLDASSILVNIGGIVVPAESITPVANSAGKYQIAVTIPRAVPAGDNVPVQLELPAVGGALTSNRATVAVEPILR